jgi:hypothetical protein
MPQEAPVIDDNFSAYFMPKTLRNAVKTRMRGSFFPTVKWKMRGIATDMKMAGLYGNFGN